MDETGSKIRLLRKSRDYTLEEFAQKVGMKEPHLSLIENGKRGISIPTLRRLLYALNTNLAAFFSSSFHDHKVIYSEKDRILLPSLKSAKIKLLVPIEGGRVLASSECVIAPGGSLGKPSSHKGEEFGYVLSGKGVLVLEGKEYPFRQGECFYYEAFIPHTIRNASAKESLRLLVVATPPSF